MNRDELIELAENPDLISGIYNYCDRWCERCPFTSRCMVYATESAESISDDPESHDLNNAKFWQKLEGIFRETHSLILEWAEEMGVDLESAEAEAAIAERGQQREEAKEHPLSVSARHYAELRSEEHTSELQSRLHLVCRLLLEKKNRAKKIGIVNITSFVISLERSVINTIIHEIHPLFTIILTMRDIKSKNVYSRVNSKATTQWRKTESANGVHLEGVASDNRSS